MSIFSSLTKGSRLNTAIKTVTLARKSEGGKADQLFLKAYQEFADVIAGDLVLAESLYNWGFALLQQARTKSGEQAIKLYEEAVIKFSFCATVDSNFLGAAIDGGVALMELARLKAVAQDHSLYIDARTHFERAEKIHKGTALYNLACIHALTGNDEACQIALRESVEYGSFPNEQEVLNDPDLELVREKAWFLDFMANLPKEIEKRSSSKKGAKKLDSVAPIEPTDDVSTAEKKAGDADASAEVEGTAVAEATDKTKDSAV